jgi:hypothetical protein
MHRLEGRSANNHAARAAETVAAAYIEAPKVVRPAKLFKRLSTFRDTSVGPDDRYICEIQE